MATTIFTVNTVTDEADGSADLGLGLSLRDAVITATSNPSEEFIIELEGGSTHTLTLQGSNEDFGLTGDIDITDGANITIRSTGAPATIDAGGFVPLGDRVFDVLSGASLILEGIEVTGGSVIGSGGGIVSAGNLTLTNSTISGNSAQYDGGGIFSYDGSLSIVGSSITNNTTNIRDFTTFEENTGGGIYASAGLTLIDSTVSGNSSENVGGIFGTGSG